MPESLSGAISVKNRYHGFFQACFIFVGGSGNK